MRIDLNKRHRILTKLINHCVWLYYRFGLLFWVAKEMMFTPGCQKGVALEVKILTTDRDAGIADEHV